MRFRRSTSSKSFQYTFNNHSEIPDGKQMEQHRTPATVKNLPSTSCQGPLVSQQYDQEGPEQENYRRVYRISY